MKKKVGIIGATGFVGSELIRLLMKHKEVELSAISSKSFIKSEISDIYGNFKNIVNLVCEDEKFVIDNSDIIFTALPHGFSEQIASLLGKNKILIDIGADFRLNEEDYLNFYGLNFKNVNIHHDAIYCIPELHRNKIFKQKIISNPGCYPTSVSLALAPSIIMGFVKDTSIIIDSKSGVSGAGRESNFGTHFTSCNENLKPYALAGVHRHIPEIEKVLNELSKNKYRITFTPYLIPINRGILSTIYFDLKIDKSEKDVRDYYKKFYENEKFIVILDEGQVAQIKNVTCSNFVHISIHKDERCNRMIIICAIDNMIKGAAGQAIQNMNIRLGFDESEGIDMIPDIF